jgi:hypothetical protein
MTYLQTPFLKGTTEKAMDFFGVSNKYRNNFQQVRQFFD